MPTGRFWDLELFLPGGEPLEPVHLEMEGRTLSKVVPHLSVYITYVNLLLAIIQHRFQYILTSILSYYYILLHISILG